MKKFILPIILAAALVASFSAGCITTMHAAQPIGSGTDTQGRTCFVISYRYGPARFNEIYN